MAQDSHPNEFVALLKERDGFIDEVNMLPGDRGAGGFRIALLRHDATRYPCCRAVPTATPAVRSARPMQTSGFFPGPAGTTLSSGNPYRKNDWRCFTADGELHELEVVV